MVSIVLHPIWNIYIEGWPILETRMIKFLKWLPWYYCELHSCMFFLTLPGNQLCIGSSCGSSQLHDTTNTWQKHLLGIGSLIEFTPLVTVICQEHYAQCPASRTYNFCGISTTTKTVIVTLIYDIQITHFHVLKNN